MHILRRDRDDRTHFTMDQALGLGNSFTFDQATMDASGVFLIGELEKLDLTDHPPLISITWPRDIDLREDVVFGDEATSYLNSSFAAAGGINPAGISWISKVTNVVPGVAVDMGKTIKPLHFWGQEAKWSVQELASAQILGRPIDVAKINVIRTKHAMDIDQLVYIGDSLDTEQRGLVNYAGITPQNVVNGQGGSPLWINKSPDEMLADITGLMTRVWTASAWTAPPTELRLPPSAFTYIAGARVSTASDTTVLEYIRNKNYAAILNGRPTNIQPLKWLETAGVGGTRRMVAYTRNKDWIRFPLVPLMNTPIERRSLWQLTTFYGQMGELEIPYPETIGYSDGF